MNVMKTIAAAAILSASAAGPVFAQEVYGPRVGAAPYAAGPGSRAQTLYDQAPGDYLPPEDSDQYHNLHNFGFTGRDPSRVGGQSPNLNPPGN
ncbi:MAG TPA: hypothetical protein VFL62_07775 [Bradyrhizobium sp.]|uniref:hypothetical protein n=1 Tax=Bradyrhizobium sp. TaxID=376 RepID=UPI002D7F4DEB|nr:hypothetical protein [Bradyrhizobium sp.]HET7886106.1 hypothetical protein [Bradyrhizobium sp.]